MADDELAEAKAELEGLHVDVRGVLVEEVSGDPDDYRADTRPVADASGK